jgi:hypothetical protein
MSNITIIPQERRAVRPLSGPQSDRGPGHDVVIDSQTYWTGRNYEFGLEHDDPTYPRYYRIAVTNLRWKQEYIVESQFGVFDENELITVAPNEKYQITVKFGGEQERDPEDPREFQLIVDEYATQHGSPNRILDESLIWVPKPDEQSVDIEVADSEARIRPWQRKATFDVALVNRSYHAVTADVRVEPNEDGKKVGIAATHYPLREAIPSLTEQPVTCVVRTDRRIKEPVVLNVDAAVETPALGLKRETAAKTVRVVPVPLLHVWYDWAVALLAAIALLWLLIGIPPWTSPSVTVVLHFRDAIPAGAHHIDLKPKLTSRAGDQPGQFGDATKLPGSSESPDKKTFTYRFQWTPRFSGFRLFRLFLPEEKVIATVTPEKGTEQTYAGMFTRLSTDGVPVATISADRGVVPFEKKPGDTIDLTIPEDIGYGGPVVLDPPPAAGHNITVRFLLNGVPLPDQLPDKPYSPDLRFWLSAKTKDAASGELSAEAKDLDTGYAWDGKIPITLGSENTLRLRKQGVQTATVDIPIPDPPGAFTYVITDVDHKNVELARDQSSGRSITPVVVPLIKGKCKADVLVTGKDDGKQWALTQGLNLAPDNTVESIQPKQPAGPNPPVPVPPVPNPPVLVPPVPNPPKPVPPKPNPKRVLEIKNLCAELQIFGMAEQISAQSAGHKAFTVKAEANLSGQHVHTVISANRHCWFQIYDCKVINGIRHADPQLTSDGEIIVAGADEPGPVELNVGQQQDISWQADSDDYVLLAWAADQPVDPKKDLLEYLKSPGADAGGWTVVKIPKP